MPARQASTPVSSKSLNATSKSSVTRPRPSVEGKARSSLGVGSHMTKESFTDHDSGVSSRLPVSSSRAAAYDRKHPPSKQWPGNARSKIPTGSRSAHTTKQDAKGKGREIDLERPRRSPARMATHQNYSLNESATSEDDEEMYVAPKQPTSFRVTIEDLPVQTPRNQRGTTTTRRGANSSAVREGSARARTSSLAPVEVLSAMKPIPLKTVYLSSPPRLGRSSETESSSESEDEVRLIEPPTTSARKRKAAAGEYTWDESSRSCIPKRERSRSRSLTASIHRNRFGPQTPGDHDDNSLLSDRSHLQDKVFTTSDNDLLKSLLTNRLRERARTEQSTPAKREQLENRHDPFLDDIDDGTQAPDDVMDMYLNIPDMEMDDLAAEQPIFDFSHTGLPDDSDDDNFGISRGTAPSSDDGFERSVIHLDNPTDDIPDLMDVTVAPEDRGDENIKIEVFEDISPVTFPHQSSRVTKDPSEDLGATTPTAVKLREIKEVRDVEAVPGVAARSPSEGTHDLKRDVSFRSEGLQSLPQPLLANDGEALSPSTVTRTVRSSSLVSNLPPSSPPPLPSYGSESAISEDDVDSEVQPTIPTIKLLQQRSKSAGPLSPKSTNINFRSLLAGRSNSPRLSPKKPSGTGKEQVESRINRPDSPATLALIHERVPPGESHCKELQDATSKAGQLEAGQPSTFTTLRSPSPLAGPSKSTDLRVLPNDQLFTAHKSPRLPHLTPIRLRTRSPAPLTVNSMAEACATPLLTPGRHFTYAPVSGRPLELESNSHRAKVETVSPLLPPLATFEIPKSPRPSPRPANTLTFPPLFARKRPSSRSPGPVGGTASAESRPPDFRDAQAPVLQHMDTAAIRSPTQPTLLLPPSPFLSRTSRSPSPNIVAENDAASLLERVRAIRSPSVAIASAAPGPANVTQSKDVESARDKSQGVEEQATVKCPQALQAAVTLDVHADGRNLELTEPGSRSPQGSQLAVEELCGYVHSEQKAAMQTPPITSVFSSNTEDISDTGLTDARSISNSDSEVGQDAQATQSRALPYTPSQSPAFRRVAIPLDDPDLSPNVTLRRDRSHSRSTSSTRSAKSTAKSPLRRPRRMSFADIGALDSSPISVAASIGRANFDALDSSSDEEDQLEAQPADSDENKEEASRSSHSKAIVERQPRRGSMDVDDLETSDEEDLNLSSSPARSKSDASQCRNPSTATVPPVTSTPARLMDMLDMQSSDASLKLPSVMISTPNPNRQSTISPKPAPSPRDSSKLPLHETRAEGESGASMDDTADPGSSSNDAEDSHVEDTMLETLVDASTHKRQVPEVQPLVDTFYQNRVPSGLRIAGSPDTSATLDEARPRTTLVVPPLANVARPSPARSSRSSRIRPKESRPEPEVDECISQERHVATGPSRETRSQSVVSKQGSVVSRQDSVASQVSNISIIQVSSADPMAAARAAAILKVHHHYIQDGSWPEGINPLARAASGSSEEGERALDDLLKQAEREVSVALHEQSRSVPTLAESSQEEASVDVTTIDRDDEPRERSMSASRHFIDQSKLDVWTRHDWRALEQCFIDELRRKRGSREPVEPAEVVRLYLESEQLRPEQCVGQWKPDLLEVRVEALIARKQQKAPRTRERSQSVVSTAYSRAPSDFFANEDAHMYAQQVDERAADTTYLDIPGALLSPGRRRYARSAEPIKVGKPVGQQDYARHRGISKYQSLNKRLPIHTSLSRETSLSSVAEAEETQSVASEPPLSTISRGIPRVYPSLDDLKAEMKPKKFLSVRGRSVAAAVNLFEKIEEEQSIEAQLEHSWMKRKASEQDLRKLADTSKRVRI